jgi:hypothetical protein
MKGDQRYMAGEIDCWVCLNLAQPIPPKSNQPNELLGIRLKPTLQLGSKGPDDSKAHSRPYAAAGASPFPGRSRVYVGQSVPVVAAHERSVVGASAGG